MWDYRISIAGWLNFAAEWIKPSSSDPSPTTNFVHLAPIDDADKAGVYSEALSWATNQADVSNIALTGPYGSGKSSIIKSFLKNYRRDYMQISLAAFLPEAIAAEGEGTGKDKVSRQEIERSILQQMLYGAEANRLPLSRFKRIQSPGRGAAFTSLFIACGVLACWHLFQQRTAIVRGNYFLPFDISNWFNLSCFVVGCLFLWLTAHRIYVASFGVSLKSISLKDIQITPEAATEESILNRHLDEIIYFFQSTKYDLVIIEDLDRFDNAEIFVTLREINSLVNANAGVKRTIRFLYALRDNMFVNTDRTKFFEFIVPVIPIINSSNSIDKMLEQGARLSLSSRLDRQFLREVSRYLNDLRLIQNIFNEYAVYVANLETDGENILDANKLLAVLIYKNVFPSDFENLHRGKGNLAQILQRHGAFIANGEAAYKAEISGLEQQLEIAERQLPADLEELRKIYAMAFIQKLPEQANYVNLPEIGFVPINSLTMDGRIDQLIHATSITWRSVQGHQDNVNLSGFERDVSSLKSFTQRTEEIEHKSAEFKEIASKRIHDLRLKIASLRVTKFSELIRHNAQGIDELFKEFGDYSELARFLVFEGFLDDTYYQYTSLFHAGRLSPSDNKFLIQIRGYINPEPEFQVDNPKEVIAAMREEDFGQRYVLNVMIVDCLLEDPTANQNKTVKLREFIASNFQQCEEFLSAYYARGKNVSVLLSLLVGSWEGFIPSALASVKNTEHAARIIAHLPASDIQMLASKYPNLSEFVSFNLSKIMASGIDFEHDRLKTLKIEAADLSGVESYPVVARMLFEEGLYRISVENVDFIFRVILGIEHRDNLQLQNYTSILNAGNDALNAKIEKQFEAYLHNVLLALPENSEESIAAIHSTINHAELGIDDLRAFLERQSAILPSLDQVPARLHGMLFELEKIEPTWENCLAFLSSESHEPETLTDYLNSDDTVSALCKSPVPDTSPALPLRKFLIENDSLDNENYRSYVKALPKEFKHFPENIGTDKQRILIEESKTAFSRDNLTFLSTEDDLQLLYVAKNVEGYLEKVEEFDLDDEFHERLLESNIRDEQKLKLIKIMDLTLLPGLPSRAAKVGPILVRTGAEISEFDADSAVAVIMNSSSIEVQISLLNKFHQKLDDQQIRTILDSLPEPYSEIKPGWGTPRIDSTDFNLEFVAWLKDRRFISSWSRGGLFDDDIRINLFRK